MAYRGLTLMIVSVLILPAGCSKEEMKQKMEQVQTQAQAYTESAVQAVEEKLPENGSLALNMSPAAEKISKLDLQLISIGDGRPNVVQIANYDVSGPRSFPSVLLQGNTASTSAAGLSGQTVQCDLYYQAGPNSPVSMTKPGGSIDVSFGALNTEDNALSGRLGSSSLVVSDGTAFQISGGELVAVIREGN
ncbi:MAG: hypothetical protein AB8B91_15435 [Rubripirellula sp.]